jgi:glycosyltransferase involved in cell wall biosynthesis
MKVLHVVQSDAFAGVERHVSQLARAQADRGDEIAVIGGDPLQMTAEGSPLVGHRPAVTLWETVVAVRSAAQQRPDVVHAHMTVAETASAVALIGTGIPLVVTRHFARVRGRNAFVAWATSVTARRISAQIAISRYVADRVEGPSTVVHPGVPIQPEALPARERVRRVLVVQRLEAEKRTDDALRIFAESGLAARGWFLEIAGDGSQRASLERLARQLGIGACTVFLGHRTDVAELMRHSGVLIAPCPIEGLGLTVLEAMASGLPVVAAASGGHLETLEGLKGAVLYAASGQGRASAAVSLSTLAADAALRDESAVLLQQAQRARFTLARQAEATDAVYRGLA